MAFHSVPVIDLSTYHESLEARQAIAKDLRAACTDVGFFYLKNTGMPKGTLEQAFKNSRHYFALPQAEKDKLPAHSNNYRGYSGLLTENVDPTNRGDLHESFDLGPEGESADGSVQHNVWPNAALLPDFKHVAKTYYRQCTDVYRKVLKLLALSLGLEEGWFEDKSDRDASILRFLYYPPQTGPVDDRVMGIGAHSDYEIVTLLWQQPGIEALQVLNAEGEWVSAPPRPDCDFIANLGDQLAMWTNDIYKSTIHRAINRSGVERYSIPCFCGVNYDTLIETLSTCITEDRPNKYKPVKAGEWVAQRLQETYAGSKPTPEGAPPT